MKKEISIPVSISSRTEYKRKFSFLELYRTYLLLPKAISAMIRNKKKQLIHENFIERIHLAITEVNGCAACSYAHTYMALNQGMSSEEINSFLSGDGRFINETEAKAIVFAQHFADTRGFPKADAYQAITKEYGEEKAHIIISAAQIMLAGNIYGIPMSAFKSRLNGKQFKESSLFYELGMQIFGILLLPIALLHGSLNALVGVSNIRLDQA
ncbi:MAG: carboxymuconolactone decarboxylase family protein [Saprospiraceae bacterium]